MEVDKIKVELFALPSGKVPFEQWINKLKDRKVRARINVRIARVRLGNFGDHRSVGEGVFELRIDYGPGYRVYYGQVKDTVVLLLCGGDKDSQAGDIAKAKEYWRNYESGQKDNPYEGINERLQGIPKSKLGGSE